MKQKLKHARLEAKEAPQWSGFVNPRARRALFNQQSGFITLLEAATLLKVDFRASEAGERNNDKYRLTHEHKH